MQIQFHNQLKSTNQYCELLDLNQVEEFTIICARCQTAGIGQKGNTWESEPFQNLSFSIILHPTFLPIADQYMLTKTISLGIYDWLQPIIPQHTVSIKWPNDIYVNNNKICGTLISNKTKGTIYQSAVCGIGININQTHFSDWIPNPISLKSLTYIHYDIEEILPPLINCIQKRYTQLQNHEWDTIDTNYLSHLLNLKKEQTYLYQGQTIQATIIGINRFGHLQLITSNNKSLSCQLKEIKLLS